jgi:hypothetical protein
MSQQTEGHSFGHHLSSESVRVTPSSVIEVSVVFMSRVSQCQISLRSEHPIYRVIQEEFPPLTELISDDILSKKCHINLGPIDNIYRVTFVFGNALL